MNRPVDRFYLLVCKSTTPTKAVPISMEQTTTSDDFGRLYEAFDRFCKIPPDAVGWAHCLSIYRDQVTPQGIPYTYELCCDGGMYRLWHLEQPKEAIEQSLDYIRHSFDVVSLLTESVTLVDWTPPAPFEVIELPAWITRKPTDS